MSKGYYSNVLFVSVNKRICSIIS